MNPSPSKLAAATWLLTLLMTAGAASADDDAAPDIDRDGGALAAELAVHPDRDTTDTAIVASNSGPGAARVVCTAFNANGRRLGAAAMRVPGNGLRYLRASDVANGADYVGQVRCTSRNQSVVGSAFLVARSGITELPVQQTSLKGVLHIQAPVTASF